VSIEKVNSESSQLIVFDTQHETRVRKREMVLWAWFSLLYL